MKKPAFFSPDKPYYPILISINVILATFLSVLSGVTTMIADSAIQGDLGLSDTQSIWLTTLYLLGVNTIVPTANWFANQFGFKRMYTYGVLIFTFGSLLAGIANNFFIIASARVIEGIGAGFIFPIGLALIVKSLSKERVQFGINIYVAGTFGAGLGLGILFAGLFTQFYTWRDIFYLIVPLGILTATSCWLSKQKKKQVEERVPFDYFGFITFALFVSSLLIALTLGPIRSTDQGWRTPYILVFFAIAVVSLISCILIERRHPNPLIPLELFKDPIFSVSLAALFLIGMAIFVSVSISVQYMLNGLFYEKYVTGKIASVYGVAIGIVSIGANYLSKVIPIPFLTFTGLSLLVFSYFYNNELSWLTGAHQVIVILLIRGVGVGLALGPTTLLALHGIPDKLKAEAATIVTFFRQVGGTYGGTLSAIFSIKQTIFHTARFSEQTNNQLPAYKMTFRNLYDKFPDPVQAKGAIVKNLMTQAYIQGLNDALVAFGYITGGVALVLMAMISYRIWKSRRSKAMP